MEIEACHSNAQRIVHFPQPQNHLNQSHWQVTAAYSITISYSNEKQNKNFITKSKKGLVFDKGIWSCDNFKHLILVLITKVLPAKLYISGA